RELTTVVFVSGLCQYAVCVIATARGNRRLDRADIADALHQADAADETIFERLHPQLTCGSGEQAAPPCALDERVAVAIAGRRVAFADFAELERIVVQAGSQQLRARVETLRDEVLAAERVAHSRDHLAAARDDRQIRDRERSGRNVATRCQ